MAPTVVTTASDVKSITASKAQFAALHANGKVSVSVYLIT